MRGNLEECSGLRLEVRRQPGERSSESTMSESFAGRFRLPPLVTINAEEEGLMGITAIGSAPGSLQPLAHLIFITHPWIIFFISIVRT